MARQLNQMQDWARETPRYRPSCGAGGPCACGYGRSPLPLFLSPDCSERNLSGAVRSKPLPFSGCSHVVSIARGTAARTPLHSSVNSRAHFNFEEMLAELIELSISARMTLRFFRNRRRTRPLRNTFKVPFGESERACHSDKHRFEGMSMLTELTRNYLKAHCSAMPSAMLDVLERMTLRPRTERTAAYPHRQGWTRGITSLCCATNSVSHIETNARGVDLRVIDRIEPTFGQLKLHLMPSCSVLPEALGDMRSAVAVDTSRAGFLPPTRAMTPTNL